MGDGMQYGAVLVLVSLPRDGPGMWQRQYHEPLLKQLLTGIETADSVEPLSHENTPRFLANAG